MFLATVSASNEADALARVTARLVDGFTVEHVQVRSERHSLFDVLVADRGGDVDDCWVMLTSYGISPSEDLGSVWARLDAAQMEAMA